MNNEVQSNLHHAANSAKPWAVIATFDIQEGCETEWVQTVEEEFNDMRHEKTFISASMCARPSELGKFLLFEYGRIGRSSSRLR